MSDGMGYFGCVLSNYRADAKRKRIEEQNANGVRMAVDEYVAACNARREEIARKNNMEIPDCLWDCFIEKYIKGEQNDGSGNYCGEVNAAAMVDNLCCNADYYEREAEWGEDAYLAAEYDTWDGDWLSYCENKKRNGYCVAFTDDVIVWKWGFDD